VHLAARMEQMAKPASILATEHTVALVRGRVATRALGPVPVRGLQAPVEVHEISGAVPIRSRRRPGFIGRILPRRGATRRSAQAFYTAPKSPASPF